MRFTSWTGGFSKRNYDAAQPGRALQKDYDAGSGPAGGRPGRPALKELRYTALGGFQKKVRRGPTATTDSPKKLRRGQAGQQNSKEIYDAANPAGRPDGRVVIIFIESKELPRGNSLERSGSPAPGYYQGRTSRLPW